MKNSLEDELTLFLYKQYFGDKYLEIVGKEEDIVSAYREACKKDPIVRRRGICWFVKEYMNKLKGNE